MGFGVEEWRKFIIITVLWTCLYAFSLIFPIPLKDKYRKMNIEEELDLRNRQISFIHGFLVLVGSGYAYFFLPGGCDTLNTSYEDTLLFISMGYFTYDFIAMAYYGR
jgi:hypothetical protein